MFAQSQELEVAGRGASNLARPYAEGVHQLTAQGCARQRATLGKGRVNKRNPEGVADENHHIQFRFGLSSRTLSEFMLILPLPRVARWRAQPGLSIRERRRRYFTSASRTLSWLRLTARV